MAAVPLQQKTAEQLARLFNVVFNSSMLYGSTHPTTLKSIAPFFDLLSKTLNETGAVSLVIDRESLFIEEWPIDKIINPRRILQQFEKSGIVSITFQNGCTHNEIELLIRYSGDSTSISPVAKIKDIFSQAGCAHIKLNYVRYGKITDDQAVVGREEIGTSGSGHPLQQGPPAVQQGGTAASMHQLEEILSLARLFEHPEKSARDFAKNALDPAHGSEAIKSIAGLRESIQSGDAPSIDLLLNAVYELKVDLHEAISVQKETGKLLAAPEPLTNEMDQLTCDVLIKLVREEYGSGDIPVRRLAEIIRRMLPDTNELKRLLPRLKPELLNAGMSLSDYLQLIRTLNFEFESESLAHTLADAASGVGASVDDLVKAIRTQPDDAARLLVMASEIRNGVQDDDAQLSTMLTDYIEKVSTGLALDERHQTEEGGSKALRQMLEQLEHQLLDNLKKYGVDTPVISRVGALLAQRLDGVYDAAAAKWISSELEARPELSPQELSEQLVRMVGEQSQLDRLHDPVMAALTARGFDREQMEAMLKKIAARIASGKMLKLPPGILSANNMQFLLDRELKQHYRYHTPFTTLLFTVVGLLSGNGPRRPTRDELLFVLPNIYSVIRRSLRDIDLVGSIPATGEETVFSLLTMTGPEGATIVRQRIQKKIESLALKLHDAQFTLLAAISITSPPENTKKADIRGFLELVSRNHQAAIGLIADQYRI
jgi:hypothetical protein